MYPAPAPDDDIFDQASGVLLTLALILGGLALLYLFWRDGNLRILAMLAARPDHLLHWRAEPGLTGWVWLAPFLPLAVLPGAWGLAWRQVVPKLPLNQRLALTVSLCGLIGLAALVEHLAYGHHIALATEAGPEWIQDGVVTDRLAWSQATRVMTSCITETYRDRHGDISYIHHLNYDVAFPDQRVARLSPGWDNARDWARAIGPIDDALRAAGVARFETHDAACLDHETDDLRAADAARFRGVMGR
jgi:hypothetical protein